MLHGAFQRCAIPIALGRALLQRLHEPIPGCNAADGSGWGVWPGGRVLRIIFGNLSLAARGWQSTTSDGSKLHTTP
jgi:hypothetical protein